MKISTNRLNGLELGCLSVSAELWIAIFVRGNLDSICNHRSRRLYNGHCLRSRCAEMELKWLWRIILGKYMQEIDKITPRSWCLVFNIGWIAKKKRKSRKLVVMHPVASLAKLTGRICPFLIYLQLIDKIADSCNYYILFYSLVCSRRASI